MKIYFTASARGTKQLGQYYKKIFNCVNKLGHKHVDDLICNVDQNNFYEGSHDERVKNYKKSMRYIKIADIVILELSMHSLSMGFLLQKGPRSAERGPSIPGTGRRV